MGRKDYEGDLYVNGKKVATVDQIPEIPQTEPNRSNIVIIPAAENDVYDYIEFENGKDMRIEGVVAEATWYIRISEGFKCSLTFRTGDIYPFLNYDYSTIFFSGTHCQDDLFSPQTNYNYRIYFTYRDNLSVNGYVVGFPNEVGVDFIGELMHNAEKVSNMPDTPVTPDIPENEGCQNNIVTLPEAVPDSYAYEETITVENGKDVRLRNVGSAYFDIIDEDDENGYFKCAITFQTPNENLDIAIEPNNRAIRYYGLHCEDTIFTPQPKYHYRLNIFNDYGDLVCIVSGFPTESKYSDFISDIMININNLNSQIGDISTALDELHEYAQSLIAGGISE